jgi:Arc/MetJ-type ribon-helix-helix transcriptional regulator
MSVDLAPDVWDEIQRQIATGSFASHDDVLREALVALRFREEEVLAIQQGLTTWKLAESCRCMTSNVNFGARIDFE